MITRIIEYSCDIPNCDNKFVDKWTTVATFEWPNPHIPDGWSIFRGYVGMLTSAIICPRHMIKFTDGEVILQKGS